MSNEHYTAWVTTDRTALENDFCDVTVLADEEIGERDGRPVWESTGDPLFHAETTVHVDDDGDAQDQAEELLGEAGWRVVGDWEAVTTGYIVTVERDADEAEETATGQIVLVNATPGDQVPGIELSDLEARGYDLSFLREPSAEIDAFFDEVGYGPDQPDELIYAFPAGDYTAPYGFPIGTFEVPAGDVEAIRKALADA